MNSKIKYILAAAIFLLIHLNIFYVQGESLVKKISDRPRIIVTTDGEIDDCASMVRFLLFSNEFDIEGIVNSSSEFHWVGGTGWNAFHPVSWIKEYIEKYAEVYPNLIQHDTRYPSPEFLLSKWKVGNISAAGEYKEKTEGARLIADVLQDTTDSRPVWIQAWGGCNTIAAALKMIQEEHPEKMQEVADKLRLFLIWEQDDSYQEYIRPHWESLNPQVIISDQFDCMAYIWYKVLPADVRTYFNKEWISTYITQGHGPLCEAYPTNEGAFNAEGDTPAYLHNISTGLRNMELPSNGGWGGRYVLIRNNVWMDPRPTTQDSYPTGKRGIQNSWSKAMEYYTDSAQVAIRNRYFKPLWRWMKDIQNDFAARADWCVKDYAAANHHPQVILKNTPLDQTVKAGEEVKLDASKSKDPDGDKLQFHWWMYQEAGTYTGTWGLDEYKARIRFRVPSDAREGDKIHLICEVTDNGTPSLTRYQRVILTVIR